jgi:hypothetical protein
LDGGSGADGAVVEIVRHRNRGDALEQIRAVRTIWRLRDRNVRDAGREIQHMKKAMPMNVQLANVLSDVLFELQQAVDRYDFCQQQIVKCGRQTGEVSGGVAEWGEGRGTGAGGAGRGGGCAACQPAASAQQEPEEETEQTAGQRALLESICGVNLTTPDGVYVMTVLTFVSELGTDMSPWRSEDHLLFWLKLAPSRQIGGGHVIKQERNRTRNRVANALRAAA